MNELDSGTGEVYPDLSSSTDPPSYDEIRDATSHILSETTQPLDDGRIAVNIDSKIARAFAHFIDFEEEHFEPPPDYSRQAPWILPMNIVIQVVGSRGDVQPFVALGNELQKSGHRVRIATHDVFKSFVTAANLEFYPIGGDPAELMAYMVRNPGLIPNMKTLKGGEISKKRKMIAEILQGCWMSCIEPDPDSQAPFVANAIIANPPSFAHIHCAQALSIPLHMVFTMPWSPTRAFPHPLANIQNSTTDPKLANFLSYGLVQCLTWQGLADIINGFRQKLDLQELPITEAPFLAETLRVPYTYCWSPAIVPKPLDWADHIDVCGFIFRNPPTYEPPPLLAEFLRSGPTPIYVGFGSIVVDNPQALLATVLAAIKRTEVRAIVSKGWSELNADLVPENVFFLGDCPHEWLFQHVSMVVHHGGAGTCAAGLLNGRPTTIVPFFGDQPFWGDRVAAAGAGPVPIPFKALNVTNLADAIAFCKTPEANEAAQGIASQMQTENGVQTAAASFYRQLSVETLRCDIVPAMPAVYEVEMKSKKVKISASAAEILVKHSKVKAKQLRLYEPKRIEIENRRWDPLTSTASSAVGIGFDTLKHLNNFWYSPYKMRKEARLNAKARLNREANSDSQSRSVGSNDPSEGSSKAVSSISTARLAGASAMSMPKLWGSFAKAVAVDVPLAMAEGFRNAPKLYGEEVPEHRPITGWKSGAIVGGQEFGKGIATGLVDIAVQPYKGAKQDGTKGFVKGVGKGILGTGSKLGTGIIALYSYPMQGVWRSIYDMTHTATKKKVFSARRVHDLYYARRDRVEERKVLDAFDKLQEEK